MQPTSARLQLPLPEIAAICQRMGVARLAMFGSSLRDDFGPQSDVDVLVHFAGDDAGPWMGKYADLATSLSELIGRKVDVVSWPGIQASRNELRRNSILRTAKVVYEQG